MNTPLTGQTLITADVTAWTAQQRAELLETIDAIQAKVHDVPLGVAGDQGVIAPPAGDAVVSVPGEVESTGWTYQAYEKVMVGLLNKNYVQAAAIMEAIKNGTGYVSRDEVYKLGKYPDSRSLKGFTRPVNRVTADVVDAGLLPEDAEELLRPDYDPAVKSFQRAKGFYVPMEVVKLALEAKAEQEKSAASEGLSTT